MPKAVRDRLGLRAGSRVDFELVDRGVVIRKGRSGDVRAVDQVRGMLARQTSTDAIVDELRGSAPKSRR